ncbi:MAG TPA: SUMF1/EgtB/PvdO family nonheme iron enzyme, partial [Kofleriaceae bacterium]
ANLRSRVSTTLEAAILVGPTRDDVRVELARALAVRLELAERMHNRELAGELANRIRTLVAAGAAPASLGMEHSLLTLVGLDLRTTVTLARQRTEPSGLIVEEAATPITEGSHDLAPGSYMVQIVLADKPAVRLPVWLHRGQRETVQLPRVPTSIPDGMIFIPAGQTQVGADEENMRVGLDMPPLHPVQVDAFLIGRFEVTMGQYAEWLDTLDAAERAARLPLNRSQPGAIELRSSASGWTLQLRPTTIEYVVRWGEPLRYRGRSAHAVQDWRRLPVTGISFDDATAFAAWLARGRLRGARLCSELEWTRAARGADDRVFTIGRRLLPGDANFDLTYGGTDVAFGPDEVGSHPKSASMFGVEDLHGNAEEIVRATRWGEATAVYGGSWYHERVQQRLDNRFRNVPSTRHMLMGFRVCSPVP